MNSVKCDICEKNTFKYRVLNIEQQITTGKLSLNEILNLFVKDENSSLICDECFSCEKKVGDPIQTQKRSSVLDQFTQTTTTACEAQVRTQSTNKTYNDKGVQTKNAAKSEVEESIQKFMSESKEKLYAIEIDGVLMLAPKSLFIRVTAYKFFEKHCDKYLKKYIDKQHREEKIEPMKVESPVVAAKKVLAVPKLNLMDTDEEKSDVMFVDEKPIEVKQEPLSPTTKKMINESFVRIKENGKMILHCIYCNEKFSDLCAVQLHIQTKHSEAIVQKSGQKQNLIPQNVLNFQKLNLEKCANGKRKCKICQEEFNNYQTASRHILTKHLCKKFGHYNLQKLNLKLVTKCRITDGKYRCMICVDDGNSFECLKRYDLYEHLKIHDKVSVQAYALGKKKLAEKVEKIEKEMK